MKTKLSLLHRKYNMNPVIAILVLVRNKLTKYSSILQRTTPRAMKMARLCEFLKSDRVVQIDIVAISSFVN